MSARKDIVQQAVALIGIGPGNKRHAECVNAVNVALSEITATEAELRRVFHRHTSDAKKVAGQLGTAIRRLQDVLNNPNIPDHLVRIFPNKRIGSDGWPIEHPDPEIRWPSGQTHQQRYTKLWLKLWREQAEAAQKAPGRKFDFKAEKKLIAAEEAHRLLQQFGRNISAAKGSTFCMLAATLHGTPNANFHHPCKTVRSVRRK